MTRNLANERKAFALIKRIRKANSMAKAVAHGGWGEEAKQQYLNKYPEVKKK